MKPMMAVCALVLLGSAVVFATDEAPPTAVVQGNGTVFVNGQRVIFGPVRTDSQGIRSTVVMPGDIIQTKEDGAASVNALGLTATAGANTIVRFQSGGIALDQGTLTVGTVKTSSVFARDFKVTPVSNSFTQFNVLRSSGIIKIMALKSDVTVSCGAGKPTTVKEGQQLSRDDAADCGLAKKPGGGAPTAGQGPILASPTAQKAALAVGGAIAAWAIFQPDDPASPSAP